jgi:hypothetical protein
VAATALRDGGVGGGERRATLRGRAAQRGRAADDAPGPAARRTALRRRGRAAGAGSGRCSGSGWRSGGVGGRRAALRGRGGAADGGPGAARRAALLGRWRTTGRVWGG